MVVDCDCSMDKELILNPLVISRNETERTMVEASINSVRISIKIKQSDELEVCDIYTDTHTYTHTHTHTLTPLSFHMCQVPQSALGQCCGLL